MICLWRPLRQALFWTQPAKGRIESKKITFHTWSWFNTSFFFNNMKKTGTVWTKQWRISFRDFVWLMALVNWIVNNGNTRRIHYEWYISKWDLPFVPDGSLISLNKRCGFSLFNFFSPQWLNSLYDHITLGVSTSGNESWRIHLDLY